MGHKEQDALSNAPCYVYRIQYCSPNRPEWIQYFGAVFTDLDKAKRELLYHRGNAVYARYRLVRAVEVEPEVLDY